MKFEQFSFMIRSAKSNKAFPCKVCLICERCQCKDVWIEEDIIPLYEKYKTPCKCGCMKELVMDEDIGEFDVELPC